MSEELLEIGDRIVALATGDEQVEVVVGRSTSTEVRVYEGEVEQLASATSAGIGVRVISGNRQGFAYAGSLDPDVLADTLAEARDNATFATPDEWLGLAEPDGVAVPSLDLYREGLAAVSTEAKIDLAVALEKAVRANDARITGIDAADYADGVSEGAVVSTTGIRTVSRDASCYVSVSCVAQDGDDTQTGFGFSVGRLPDELDIEAAAADAGRRATRLLGATQPRSGRVTVVLDPYVTAQFLGIIGSTLSGEAVLKGRSLFADRLGEEVASAAFTLVDDATNPLAYSASETDGEGLASRRNVLIDGGRLQQFVHNAYTARRSDTTSTANAVRGFSSTPSVGCRALSLSPGTKLQDELLADLGEGVLISSVSGLHSGVNPVSGDFSTGAEGLRISGGQLAEPLREFTIASTLQRMLSEVAAVGADLEWLPMRSAGVSLVVRDVTVSGA
ncbi:TldD/PmbA family protein [Aquihabitans sp. G128]|uniref:TldD/PmbA family protein n=1 Tax=Aquihabitans sp. G128 TaxID=2849779 RepID=UPI001C24343D|nr:TldD/PmbA family protein [Aquihabitans sp. G128]QXC63270.1 TldD/PmbA family protein [Aquihabitans sp. G128]